MPKVLSVPVCWVVLVGKEFRPSASSPSLVLVLTEVESAPEEQSGEPERPEASHKACWA